MRLRRVLPVIIAALMAMSMAVWPSSATSVCDPGCGVAGTVIGSVIRPPYDMVIQGFLTDGSGNQYRFNVEGPYNFVGGNLGRGTVKIVGPGAPDGQNKLWVAVAFDGTLNSFHMRNVDESAKVLASGDFTFDGQNLFGSAQVGSFSDSTGSPAT